MAVFLIMDPVFKYIADSTFEYDSGTSKARFLWDKDVVTLHLSSGTPPRYVILSDHEEKVLLQIEEYLEDKLKAWEVQ